MRFGEAAGKLRLAGSGDQLLECRERLGGIADGELSVAEVAEVGAALTPAL